ncbi:hypothetical protein JKY72_03475 [Candidatus Gracilibacteria bacterium]|nr:hypothetical protein [Candidatus Gracilibacteria bacterium]
MNEAGKQGVDGLASRNTRVYKGWHYAEGDVRAVCRDMFTFELGGVRFGTLKVWSEKLDVSIEEIDQGLGEDITVVYLDDNDEDGTECYSEADVLEACSAILEARKLENELPIADKQGLLKSDGHTYRNLVGWSKETGARRGTLKAALEAAGKKPLPGKVSGGQRRDFYLEQDVLDVCGEIILTARVRKHMPQADKEGVLTLAGQEYRSVIGWSNLLSACQGNLAKNLKNARKLYVDGKNHRGQQSKFYSEEDVRDILGRGFFSWSGGRESNPYQ